VVPAGKDGLAGKLFFKYTPCFEESVFIMGTGKYDGMGALQMFYRFAQRTQGKQRAVSKRALGIEEHEIQVSFQWQVLKSVVEKEHVRAAGFNCPFA
jgi:hypothetical protein